jgi:hypothetical protein
VSVDPRSGSFQYNCGLREERLWSPEQIRSLPKYHGLLFMDGARPQPVWCPRYFVPGEFPELRGRYDDDPYHPGAASAGRSFFGQVGRAAALSAAMIAGGALLSPAGESNTHPAAVRIISKAKSDPPARVSPKPPPRAARR